MEKNSKKSIIIGISSLLLVTLLLIGLTYAYYRTRVIGNQSEDPSISVQSKTYEIKYTDGTAEMNMTGKIEPGFNATKTFTVENTGDEDIKFSIVLDNVTNTFTRVSDWTYTLTQSGVTEPIASGTLTNTTMYLVKSTEVKYNTTNTYTLTINYVNDDEFDQSEDMGATLSFRVNIDHEQYTWDNAADGTLLYLLKNNQPAGSETTTPGQAVSTANEKRVVSTPDDFGTSYMYRGAVDNNFVSFSGMCWRVVRVQGDGTIKLILEDKNAECGKSTSSMEEYFYLDAYIYSEHYDSLDGAYYEKSLVKDDLGYFITYEVEDTNNLVVTQWCNDTSISSFANNTYYYGAYERLNNVAIANPSLECNHTGIEVDGKITKSTKYSNSIGILSADEIAFAGGAFGENNTSYYLNNHSFYSGIYTMSPYVFGTESNLISMFYANDYAVSIVADTGSRDFSYIRPVITLKSSTLAVYDEVSDFALGTEKNPYLIVEDI